MKELRELTPSSGGKERNREAGTEVGGRGVSWEASNRKTEGPNSGQDGRGEVLESERKERECKSLPGKRGTRD